MIKILIAEDSPTEAAALKALIESEQDFQVIGHAKNGKEAVEMVNLLNPDLVTMDMKMPIMDGLEATRLIMAHHPTPIVVVSSLNNNDNSLSYKALEAGALSIIDKPRDIASTRSSDNQKKLLYTIRSMAEIKVITRRFYSSSKEKKSPILKPTVHDYELIAIGTSVGGPQVLKKIFNSLPADFPIPIIVVQHMTCGFIKGFAQWLDDNLPLQVKEAEDQEILKAKTIYFAPDYFHLEIKRRDENLIVHLSSRTPVSGFRPSATVMLQSVAKVCGPSAIGVLLTGMGSDGALGLLDLRNAKGHTIIQDPKSALVFGMAGVAQAFDAVDQVVELDNIANYLIKLATAKQLA